MNVQRPPGQPGESSNELAEERTELARTRTIIAAERTLMAWIRTSISMIGFGFSIFKFFDYLKEAEGFHGPFRAQSPRRLGLALIVLGTAALIVAICQHVGFLRKIAASERGGLWSLSVIVAILMVLIGVFAFVNVLLRTGPF